MAGRPPARHRDRGSWEDGYRDADYTGGRYPADDYPADGYPADGYPGDRYPADDHPGAGGRHAAHQDGGYRDGGYRDGDGRDFGGRDAGSWDAGHHARQPGGDTGRHGDDRGSRDGGASWDDRGSWDGGGSWDGRGGGDGRRAWGKDDSAGWRGGVHESRGGRVSEPRGGLASETRRNWDDQRPGSWAGDDREVWAGDSQIRAGERDWAGERDGWADERGGWAGERDGWAREPSDWSGNHGAVAAQDPHSWDVGVWGWDDEDGPEDGGYQGTGHRRDSTGGAEGNKRLTALVGTVLLVLFAAEGLTILSVHQLLTLHFFLGMLLVGPVVLKACSVLYRFVRYYTGAEEYHRKGPPAPLLRVLGPVVLVTSVSVIGTGIMLAITGPSGLGTWLFLHRASFILWFGAMTVHVLAYVWRLPRLVSGDLASRAGRRAHEVLAGRSARWLLLAASILTGLLLAMLTVHRVGLWSMFH